jgi:ribonuclease-3
MAYPQYTEGDLTKLRQQLVCEETLSELAAEISLGSYLSLGKGEEQAGARKRASILADALEALIAAVDIDSHGKATAALIDRLFGEKLRSCHQISLIDYKTKLQQLVQQDGNEELAYVVISASGPEHDKVFEVEAHINSNVVGRGFGKSKRDAEQAAAKEALLLFGVKL